MGDDLRILIPVLRRPNSVERALASAIAATPGARVLFLPDPDDEPEREAILEAGGDELPIAGSYAHKINQAVAETEDPLLFFGADDLEFHAGWLDEARKQLLNGIGVVATNDLCNPRVLNGTLATHPLVTREYCNLGTIDDHERPLHEGYIHNYVDREFSETAQARQAFAYAEDAIVEHLHPFAEKGEPDVVYRIGRKSFGTDRRTYMLRRRQWKRAA